MAPNLRSIDALEALAAPICAARGVELVEVRLVSERGRAVLRVTIDRMPPDGSEGSAVSLDDCTGVSRDLSAALDVHEELLPDACRLEVSSPGLERPLLRPADYLRFAGKQIRLSTNVPLAGQHNFQGRLEALEQGEVVLHQDGKIHRIPLENVSRAHLVYEF